MISKLIALLLLFTSVSAFAGNNTDKDWNVFLDALWQKESSQRLNPPDGDGGKAIGPYQIWEVYWIDAKDHDKSLTANGETYQSCRDKDYAERVIKAYMSRWDRKSWTGVTPSWESKARLHNGGCNIYKKRGKKAWHDTTKYWQQVSKYMKQQGSK